MRILFTALASVCLSVVVSDALAQTRSPTRYSCRAAKNLAVVGAWDNDGVQVVERSVEQECRFSINGAPAGTPPLDQVLAAWAFIRRPGWTAAASFPVERLALALSAAAPFDSIAPGLSDAISKNAEQLFKCFQARDAGQPIDVSSEAVTCRSVRQESRGILRVPGSPGVEFSTSAAQIQLAIRATNTVHYLFLPAPPVVARPPQ